MNEKILHINSDEFENIVLKSSTPVIVDFYSEDCAPCEVLAPIFEKMVIRTKLIRQVITAVSDGAVAGIMDERYIVNNKI